MDNRDEQLQAFSRLLAIMDDLREKCPWDRKQTMESLRYLTIEETYELGDAILDEDLEAIKKELGDLLMHIVFYAKIGSEKKSFDIGDVTNQVSDKLIERHPHIYGKETAQNAKDVERNWEAVKIKKEGRKSVLQGVPRSLPALVKADRIQDKVSGVGFDWENPGQVLEKVGEELEELKNEIKNKDQDKIESEFGDVLFAMINYGRFLNVNAENALERTNKKFIRRFQYMEDKIREREKSLNDMDLSEMNVLWEAAKVNE